MLLSKVAENRKVKITELQDSPFKVKMMEMGLVEGQDVEIAFRAPFGDPIAVSVSGNLISLRINEANKIEVEYPLQN